MYQTEACYPVIAPVQSDTAAGITYSAGMVIGQLMNVSRQYQYAEASLYGDNRRVDYERELTGANITAGVTWLPAAAGKMAFGQTEISNRQRRTDLDTSSNAVGFGYVKKAKRTDTGIRYVACWTYKVSFSRPDESTTTKSGNIQFNTPSMQGVASFTEQGYLDEEWEYDTLADAKEKINSMANISSAYVADPVIATDNDVVYEGSVSVTITCVTDGATIYYTTDGTDPDATATAYTAAIALTESTQIKAVAVKSTASSNIVSKIYAVVADEDNA